MAADPGLPAEVEQRLRDHLAKALMEIGTPYPTARAEYIYTLAVAPVVASLLSDARAEGRREGIEQAAEWVARRPALVRLPGMRTEIVAALLPPAPATPEDTDA